MCHDDYQDNDGGHWDDNDEDKLSDWYDGYKKRKAQKAKIKKQLMPNTWHPSRYWDWCMLEDKKKKKKRKKEKKWTNYGHKNRPFYVYCPDTKIFLTKEK